MLAYKIFLYYPHSYCFRESWTCENVGTNKPIIVSSHMWCHTRKATVTHKSHNNVSFEMSPLLCVFFFWGWGGGGCLGVLEMCDHGCLGGLGMRSVKTGSQCSVF